MTLIGTLRFRDIGPGAWTLEAPDGTVHDLAVESVNPDKLSSLRDQIVEVEGSQGGFGFGMMGEQSVTVRKLRSAR
jgi:hypothetical protein